MEDFDGDFDPEEFDYEEDYEEVDIELCSEVQIVVEHRAVVWCGKPKGHYPPTLHMDMESGQEWVQPTVHGVWNSPGKTWMSFTTRNTRF